MTSRELVIKTMKGENPGRTPVYGWVLFELEKQIEASVVFTASASTEYSTRIVKVEGDLLAQNIEKQ